jgi:hypothetical protein
LELGEVFLEKSEGALAGEFGGFGAEGVGIGVAVEGVAGALVDEDLDLGMSGADGFDLVMADVGVVGAEVDHDRAGGFFGGDVADAAGVIGDAAAGLHPEIFPAGGGEPGDEAAVAEADDAAVFSGELFGMLEGGGDVKEGEIGLELGVEGEGLLHVVGGVRELEVALDAVEERGRDAEEALGGILVCDGADVGVDAEDLLHDDESGDWLAGGFGHIGREFVTIFGLEFCPLTHGDVVLRYL